MMLQKENFFCIPEETFHFFIEVAVTFNLFQCCLKHLSHTVLCTFRIVGKTKENERNSPSTLHLIIDSPLSKQICTKKI